MDLLILSKALLEPLLVLTTVMVISGVLKETNAMSSVYALVKPYIKSKRGMVALLSLIFGVVPITTRIGFACAMLDSVQDKARNNQKMGTIAYLASHHYYLWSPIEKSVIITCGILGISYLTFMSYMWIPALIAIIFSVVYIFASVTEDEVYLSEAGTVNKGSIVDIALLFLSIAAAAFSGGYAMYVFAAYAVYLLFSHKKFDIKWLDFKLLGVTAALIVFGKYVGTLDKAISAGVTDVYKAGGGIVAIAALSYLASFVMGSSAKFAAMCGMLVKFFGIKYLPLFYIIEYTGYLISPAHKCVAIGKLYFKTPIGMYFLPILALSLILIMYAVLVTVL